MEKLKFKEQVLKKDQKEFLNKFSDNIVSIDENLKKELTNFVDSFLNLRQLKKTIGPLMDGISKNLEEENINKHGYQHVFDVACTACLSYLSIDGANKSPDEKIRNVLKIFISGILHDVGYINGLIKSGNSIPISKGEKYGNHATASGHIFRGVVEDKINKFDNGFEKKDIIGGLVKKDFFDFFDKSDLEDLLKEGKKMILNHDSPELLTEGMIEVLSKDTADMHLYIGDKILCNVNRQPDKIDSENLLNRNLNTFAHKRIAFAIKEELVIINKDNNSIVYSIKINPDIVNQYVAKNSKDKDIFEKFDKYNQEDYLKDFTVFKKRFIYLSLIYGKSFNHNFSSGAFDGFKVEINFVKDENGKEVFKNSVTEIVEYESEFTKNLKGIVSGINNLEKNYDNKFKEISENEVGSRDRIRNISFEDIKGTELIKDKKILGVVSDVYSKLENILTRQDIKNKISKSDTGSDIFHNLMLNKDFKESFSERINSLENDEKNDIMLRIFDL